MRQVEIFVSEFGEIAFSHRFFLIMLWNCRRFEKPCLSEEERLHLEWVVTMMSHLRERDVFCPRFKGLPIHTKAEITGKSHEIGGLPRTFCLLQTFCYGLRLLLQTLGLQRAHPTVYCQF